MPIQSETSEEEVRGTPIAVAPSTRNSDTKQAVLNAPVEAGSSVWGPAERARAWERMRRSESEPLDLLVIGGGVVGAGAALDAALRGIDVALVEERDVASGTSSRSSRLAHGGLRYLEQMEFALVHEALRERGLLLDRLAPHLVRPLAFVLPLRSKWQRPYIATGLQLYDALSRLGSYGGTMPRPRALRLEQARALAPGLNVENWAGGALTYFDAQIDDARHTLACVRSAVRAGAAVASRAKAVSFLEENGRVAGALVRDTETGAEIKVRAKCVLSAAGPWTNEILGLVGEGAKATVRRSRGVHLVVRGDAIPHGAALIARTPSSVLFLLPWERLWLVGTTDDDWDGDLAEPGITASDVEYLLSQANRWLREPLSIDDVVGAYAGLRPLVADGAATTSKVSREHAIGIPRPGLVIISGGKYTTYRSMAEQVVDAAVVQLRQVGRHITEAGSTDVTPLVGADRWHAEWERRRETAAALAVPVETVEHLLRRHGDRIERIVQLIADDHSLCQPVHPDLPYLRAEVVTAVLDEGARSVEDVLVRRTRIAIETRDPSPAIDFTVKILAQALGWDEQRCEQEVQVFESSPRAGVPI